MVKQRTVYFKSPALELNRLGFENDSRKISSFVTEKGVFTEKWTGLHPAIIVSDILINCNQKVIIEFFKEFGSCMIFGLHVRVLP